MTPSPALTINLKINYWLLFHSALVLSSIYPYLTTGSYFHIPLLWLLSLFLLASFTRAEWRNNYFLGGPANWVTWFRLFLLIPFFLLLDSGSPWLLAGTGLAGILLDGLDGSLARKYLTQSLFGEYLDKEADALFVMAMTIGLYETGYAGGWILSLGLIRFAAAFPSHFLKAPAEKDAKKQYARIIAGIVMVGLPLAFIAPLWLYAWALPAMGLLLAYSFLRGFADQWKATAMQGQRKRPSFSKV